MKNILLIILFFSFFNSHSQIVFEKYFGAIGANNIGSYVQQVSSGFIISGSTENDGIIIRTNEFGDSLWQKIYSNGSAECLRPSGNGGYILAGTDYNSPYNAVFRNVDSIGNVLWDTLTSSNPFTMYGLAAMQMPDGDFALLENDAYPFLEYLRIRKISATNRSTLWAKEISIVANCSSSSFQLTYDSAIVVANGTFDTPYPRLILSKTLSNGTFDWKKDYSFVGDTGIAGNSVAQTADSGFIVIGYKVFGNAQSQNRLFLMKTKANGDSLWTKVYNLKNSNAFPDVIQTVDGGYALIGTVVYPPQGGNFDYRIILMKTDSNGDSLWTREFKGYGLSDAKKIIQTSDGGFAIVGTSTDQILDQTYLYFIKTDSLGGIIPSYLPCNPEVELNFPDNCNPDSNLFTIPSFGIVPNDYYWYNSAGTLLKASMGRTVQDTLSFLPPDSYYVIINDSGICGLDTLHFLIPEPISVHIDSVTNTTCIGCANGSIYFTTSGGLPPYVIDITGGILSGNMISNVSAGINSICIIDGNNCYSCDQATILDNPTMISSDLSEHDFLIYPNPAFKLATLKFFGEGFTTIRIRNMNGELIKVILNKFLSPGNHELSVDCNEMAKGCYTIEITDGINISHKKLIFIF